MEQEGGGKKRNGSSVSDSLGWDGRETQFTCKVPPRAAVRGWWWMAGDRWFPFLKGGSHPISIPPLLLLVLFFFRVRKAPLRCRPTFKGLYNTGSGLEGNCRIPLAFSLREKFLGIKQFGKEVLGFFSLRSELGIVLGSRFSFFFQ